MINFERSFHPDDHLQEIVPSWWSFAKSWSIQMIICKRPVDLGVHLQKAGLSWWSFAGAGRSGWSFARGQFIWMIICKRLDNQDDNLQEAGPSGWSFAKGPQKIHLKMMMKNMQGREARCLERITGRNQLWEYRIEYRSEVEIPNLFTVSNSIEYRILNIEYRRYW